MLSLHTVLAFAIAAIAQTGGSDSSTMEAPPEPAFETPVPVIRQWDSYRSVLALNLGLGSAVGTFGITYALSLTSFLETELGIGYGWTGTQYSLMQKVILRDAGYRDRFVAGVGLAYAYFNVGNREYPEMEKSGSSAWLNLDLAGWEIRAANHFVFFVAGGLAIGLAGGKFEGISDNPDCGNRYCRFGSKVPGYITPQLRIGIGVWF